MFWNLLCLCYNTQFFTFSLSLLLFALIHFKTSLHCLACYVILPLAWAFGLLWIMFDCKKQWCLSEAIHFPLYNTYVTTIRIFFFFITHPVFNIFLDISFYFSLVVVDVLFCLAFSLSLSITRSIFSVSDDTSKPPTPSHTPLILRLSFLSFLFCFSMALYFFKRRRKLFKIENDKIFFSIFIIYKKLGIKSWSEVEEKKYNNWIW